MPIASFDLQRRIRFSDPIARHRAASMGVARRRRTRFPAWGTTLFVAAGVSILGAWAGASRAANPNPTLPDVCVTTPALVVSDAAGDQTPFPAGQDLTAVSAGEDYRFTGSERLVFILKVADLAVMPASGVWRARFTVGATTYYVAMNSDADSSVTFDYGTQSGNLVTSVGALESGTWATDGTITMAIAMSKVGNPPAGAPLTAVSGVTQQNVGGTLFAGVDSTSSGTYTVRAQPAGWL